MDKKLFASLLGKQVAAPSVDESARPKDLAGSFLKDVAGGWGSDTGDWPGFIQSYFDSFGESGGFISTFAQGSGTP